MVKSYLFIPVTDLPVKGRVQKIELVVKTAPIGGATKARLMLFKKAFSNTDAGFRAALLAANRKYCIFDSDSDGVESIDITGATYKVPLSRTFNDNGIQYTNKDDENANGDITGFASYIEFNSKKKDRLYALVVLDNTITNGSSDLFDINLDAVETA
jgi:hypothetical protein